MKMLRSVRKESREMSLLLMLLMFSMKVCQELVCVWLRKNRKHKIVKRRNTLAVVDDVSW